MLIGVVVVLIGVIGMGAVGRTIPATKGQKIPCVITRSRLSCPRHGDQQATLQFHLQATRGCWGLT